MLQRCMHHRKDTDFFYARCVAFGCKRLCILSCNGKCRQCDPKSFSTSGFSRIAIECLTLEEQRLGIAIQHAGKEGGETKIEGTLYHADGFYQDPSKVGTLLQRGNDLVPYKGNIAEFHGCYWHGCTKTYSGQEINVINGKTMAFLHQKTVERRIECELRGYEYVEIWECDYRRERQSGP